MSCHLPASMRQGTITLSYPVHTGQKYTFSFTCSDVTGAGGALPVAGLNVFASCGTLVVSSGEPNTKILAGELVHSQPAATTNNSKTWEFSWTAPGSPTSCGFNVTGLLGSGDKKASGGDVTCMAMKALLVAPVPDAGLPDLPRPVPDAGAGDTAAGDTAADTGEASSDATGNATDATNDGCGCELCHTTTLPLSLCTLVVVLLCARRQRSNN